MRCVLAPVRRALRALRAPSLRSARQALLLLPALLVGCAGTPVADWQLDSHAAMQQTITAALTGEPRIEAAAFERARNQIARTGRTDLLARAELMRCAAHAARLDGGACPGFDAPGRRRRGRPGLCQLPGRPPGAA
jgi:hypothetical protein